MNDQSFSSNPSREISHESQVVCLEHQFFSELLLRLSYKFSFISFSTSIVQIFPKILPNYANCCTHYMLLI